MDLARAAGYNAAHSMKASQRNTVALSLVVCATFLYLAFRAVPVDEVLAHVRRIHTGWLLVSVMLSLLIMIFRAWRWQLELRPLERIPFGRLWVVTAVAYMAINLLPARLGEVVRPWLLSRRSSVCVLERRRQSGGREDDGLGRHPLLHPRRPAHDRATCRTGCGRGALFPAVGAAVLVVLVVLLWWRGEAFVDRWVLRSLPERFGAGLKRIARRDRRRHADPAQSAPGAGACSSCRWRCGSCRSCRATS